jgi:hypothetical protein
LAPAAKVGPRLRGCIRVALAAVPVVIALFLAQQQFTRDSNRTAPGSGEPTMQDYLDSLK